MMLLRALSSYNFCLEEPRDIHTSAMKCNMEEISSDKMMYVLFFSNLPQTASKSDILELFADNMAVGVSEQNVHIVMGEGGEPNGTAFVEFSNKEEMDKLMESANFEIGLTKVEATYKPRCYMDEKLAGPNSETDYRYVLIKGMSPTVRKEEIINFFPGLGITENDIILQLGVQIRGASIKLSGPTALEAVLEFHRKYWDSRYLEIFEMKKEAYEKEVARYGVQEPELEHKNEDTCNLYVKGFPYRWTGNDVGTFFFPAIPVAIQHLARGSAIVTFANAEDKKKAMTKNRTYMDANYIEVSHMTSTGSLPNRLNYSTGTRFRQQNAQNQHYGGRFNQQNVHNQNDGGRFNQQRPLGGASETFDHDPDVGFEQGAVTEFSVRMGGLPSRVTCGEVAEFFLPHKVVHIILSRLSNGLMNGLGEAYFNSHAEAEAALGKNMSYLGSRYIVLRLGYQLDARIGAGRPDGSNMLPIQPSIAPIACGSLLNNKSFVGSLLLRKLKGDNIRGLHTQPALPRSGLTTGKKMASIIPIAKRLVRFL